MGVSVLTRGAGFGRRGLWGPGPWLEKEGVSPAVFREQRDWLSLGALPLALTCTTQHLCHSGRGREVLRGSKAWRWRVTAPMALPRRKH